MSIHLTCATSKNLARKFSGHALLELGGKKLCKLRCSCKLGAPLAQHNNLHSPDLAEELANEKKNAGADRKVLVKFLHVW